jgi:hypothetical protein
MSMKHTLRFAAAASTCLAALAASAMGDGIQVGYTCCNLHHAGDWISDANWASLPMIPAGTPIKVLGYGPNRAYVEIAGMAFRVGHDFGRDQESVYQYVARLVVADNPREKIATWPEPVREAVWEGKVIPGMTREQAIVAAGYPATHRTPVLDAPRWTYWNERLRSYQVTWTADGTVREVARKR